MKRVVTAGQMRRMDENAMSQAKIPGIVLMENAGQNTAREIMDLMRETGEERAVIICGKGNNGGDGFVIARHLLNHGFDVSLFLAADPAGLKGDAKINYDIVCRLPLKIHLLLQVDDLKTLPREGVLVDALLGTGVTGEITGLYAQIIRWMNEQDGPVVAVDTPSGLNCDTGQFAGTCVLADVTVTMAQYKRGLLFSPGRDLAGHVMVADISMPESVAQSVQVNTYLLEESDIRFQLPYRLSSSYKGDCGKALVLAGSPGMTGAAALASTAVLSAGGGLTILGIPQSLNSVLEMKLTEVMTRPLPETPDRTLSLQALDAIHDLLTWADVLALGPGLSGQEETRQFVRALLAAADKPLVLDADGLNALAGQAPLLKKTASPLVLTPHYGELARLTGQSIDEIAADPVEKARDFAREHGCVLVLKGAPTVIAVPDGTVYINATGNAGMATAGSGDVLTGMITGFLAQGLSPEHAAQCGVFMHGLAGDLAASVLGQRSLMAGHLIDFLPQAFQRLEEDA